MNERKELVTTEEKNIEKTRDLRTAIPAVDIYENNNEILLQADMPGVVKEDVSVKLDNGTLSLSGIRKTETSGASIREEFSDVEYVRSFSVPQTIEMERVEAEFKDGVLKLHLPKSEEAKPRQIEINAV